MEAASVFSFSSVALARVGVSIEALCERADVPPSNRWNTDEFFRIWAAAEEAFPDRTAGLQFGAEGIDRGYGIAAILGLHAPDLRHAIFALSRYKRLTCPELVELETIGEEAIVRYRWLHATTEVPRLLVDVTMASLREMVRRGSGGTIAPIRLELARRPMDRVLLHDYFGCPIVFGAAHEAMIFSRNALELPFKTADGGAFAVAVQGLEGRLIKGEGHPELIGELRVAIARQLSEGRSPSVAALAARLGFSSRTLQRRLDKLGTCVQQELAGVRRTTANRLLADTDLDTISIALLLGFTEPNSFTRAFRSWEQVSPRRWRARRTARRHD